MIMLLSPLLLLLKDLLCNQIYLLLSCFQYIGNFIIDLPLSSCLSLPSSLNSSSSSRFFLPFLIGPIPPRVSLHCPSKQCRDVCGASQRRGFRRLLHYARRSSPRHHRSCGWPTAYSKEPSSLPILPQVHHPCFTLEGASHTKAVPSAQ